MVSIIPGFKSLFVNINWLELNPGSLSTASLSKTVRSLPVGLERRDTIFPSNLSLILFPRSGVVSEVLMH